LFTAGSLRAATALAVSFEVPEAMEHRHSQVAEIFVKDKSGGYRPRNPSLN
jgi:hypothetical protein